MIPFLVAFAFVIWLAACFIASEFVQGTAAKRGLRLLALAPVLFGLIWLVLPDSGSPPSPMQAAAPSVPVPATTGGGQSLELRNLNKKGDSTSIECSGPTGNIKCRPAR